ncbi:two-component system histidine kinase PnpS [Piscibacillus halophilus]|uniref:histidine kinase n=1 Tax=Piscibacillus halophilus TaxID=571933 RepID=A0A1H9ICD8_9BACI|nr:ATP-binding protein [Piscibacillus halophilus]SEQ72182.1 PAS/PAC sensor signal transduction histidine kinase [Piscibacillus halophilus]
MKGISDRKALIVYTLIGVIFILVLGVLFVQVAKHYVINAYEEQLKYDTDFVADDLDLNIHTTLERQQQLERYSDSFPIDLVLYQRQSQEYLHTFNRNETITLNEIINRQFETEETTLLNSRLVESRNLNDELRLVVISDELPIRYLETTLWSIVVILSLLVGFFVWGFGNRLYENYVTPIRKASDTAKELADGNYKARIHDAPYGIVSELSQSINRLARNLESITSKYRNQNDRLKTVVNNMESGLLLINEKGLTRLANEPFVKNFTNQTSIVGEIYYDVIENKVLNDALQEVIFMERKKQLTVETEQGNYFEVYLAPIRNNEETWKGVVVVCHDITKIKQLENIRKDFVANVSHELRTPITSIQGFVETLLDGNQHDEEIVKKFLRIMDKETKRLNKLIQDLLDLSTIEKDDFTLTRTHFAASELMNEIHQVVEKSLQDKELSADIEVEDGLQVYADYNRIYQLVLNLYSNAIQYTPEGGQIRWKVSLQDGYVRLQISDTGIGIPKRSQGRIFERFYRVDQDRSRQTGGTGLGLSIVKHIVEAHEGMIDLESEEGQGTTITVSIPQHI